MKPVKAILGLLAIFLGIMSSIPAFAHGPHYRGRVQFGIFVGPPVFWHYPRPYYYPPSVVVAPASPPVYIERSDPAAAGDTRPSYWYYCPEAKAYYPYVKQCPDGWQRVLPTPPNS